MGSFLGGELISLVVQNFPVIAAGADGVSAPPTLSVRFGTSAPSAPAVVTAFESTPSYTRL